MPSFSRHKTNPLPIFSSLTPLLNNIQMGNLQIARL